ncbi:response regulator [Candidatus Cloacimonadota bacterium]
MREEQNRIRILVVDDNELSLRTMQKSFRLNGYCVDAEKNQNTAISKHLENNYDLIISDIMMPDLDGYQLTELIKSKTPDTKIILFTGFYTKDKIEKGKAAGADEVYPKPLPIIEILENLNQIKKEKL